MRAGVASSTPELAARARACGWLRAPPALQAEPEASSSSEDRGMLIDAKATAPIWRAPQAEADLQHRVLHGELDVAGVLLRGIHLRKEQMAIPCRLAASAATQHWPLPCCWSTATRTLPGSPAPQGPPRPPWVAHLGRCRGGAVGLRGVDERRQIGRVGLGLKSGLQTGATEPGGQPPPEGA